MTNFITFDDMGVHTASFIEIQAALIDEFKKIYGSDIDVSTASADGVYINTLALIINNILQCVNALYTQLDVNSARGKNLDALCALSNVFRRQATFSKASITVQNVGASTVTIDKPKFVDQASVIWVYDDTLTLSPLESKSIFVTCEEVGPVSAPSGWINQTLNSTTLVVTQGNAAIEGEDAETDASLRSRRALSSRISANTVLEALQAALLEVDGIEDVFIYNNMNDTTSPALQAADNTYIEGHSIYVIIRKNPNITIDDETIGQLIHKKLTPGIKTIQSNGTMGVAKSYLYSEKLYNTYISDSDQHIYWKQASVGYAPDIACTITINPAYFRLPSGGDDREVKEIAEKMFKWLNGLAIGDTVNNDSAKIMSQLYDVDPRYNGLKTFTVNSVSVSSQIKPDTFYDYGNYTWANVAGNQYTLTLKTNI